MIGLIRSQVSVLLKRLSVSKSQGKWPLEVSGQQKFRLRRSTGHVTVSKRLVFVFWGPGPFD